ncbi:lipase family protein [Nocardia sp. NPDC051832]|uniref:lipase family protein n=1 Tax=Nocardia sp. NPDC051832 TaxID=3155673 RepID=UPI00343B10B9
MRETRVGALLVAIAMGVVGGIALTALKSGHAAAVPLPASDSFYTVPADISAVPNGTVLASRPIEAAPMTLPLPADAWQIQYKTIDNHARPSGYVATVLVPHQQWSGPGPRPLLSYQVAEDSAGSQCAPSYTLRGGLGAGPTMALNESGFIRLALQQGWSVVVPDYQGPNSDFSGADGYASGVLDGVRAAKSFAPADIDPAAPIGLWGYSGGALATAAAVQAQPTYAPELRVSGVALGGVVADHEATLRSFSGSVAGGALAIGLVGLLRSYPEADVLRYLNEFGRQVVAQSQTYCLHDAMLAYPFLKTADVEAWPGSLTNNPEISKVARRASPLFRAGVPTAPVLLHHAINDEFAPIGAARALAEKYCAGGAAVALVQNPIGEHGTETMTGLPVVIAYLADRFAGKSAPSTC